MVQVLVGHHLAGEENVLQIRRLLPGQDVHIGHVDQDERHPEHEGNPFLVEIVHQLGREGETALRNDVQRRPGRIHQVDVQGGIVEVERRLVADDGFGTDPERVHRPVDVVDDAPVRDDHPLGRPGRPAGEDAVHRVRVDLERIVPVPSLRRGPGDHVFDHQHDSAEEPAEPVRMGPVRNHAGGFQR